MRKFVGLLLIAIMIGSCEDVVELDLNNADPRLVIDASIELEEDRTTFARVLLTRTADFYTEGNPVVEGAMITIDDDQGNNYVLTDVGFGLYSAEIRTAEDGISYTLRIEEGNNIYTATEQLVRTSPLIEVEQEIVTGFGDDVLKLTGFYNDPPGLGNYYLFEYEDPLNQQVDVGDDEFLDGNTSPTIFFFEDFEAGDLATFRSKGIDQECYNFYRKLLDQSGEGSGGGPFSTPPATVRGNIINSTNPERYPFGYFRVSEVFTLEYTIQPTD